MFRKVFFAFLFCSSAISASTLKLEVLTFSPGSEIYSSWGHNAIRVTDSEGKQHVFDYGTFQYDDSFLFKFLAGTPKYWLSKSTWQVREFITRRRDVAVWSHNILLPQPQIASIALSLDRLSKNELDKFYDYDALINNCTTKIRDLLVDSIGSQTFSEISNDQEKAESFRSIHEENISGGILFHLGIITLFNHEVEKKINRAQQSYLPKLFYKELEALSVKFPGIVEPGKLILKASEKDKDVITWQTPAIVSLLLLLVLFQFSPFKQSVYIITGVIRGLLFAVLALFFFSQWNYFSMNPALLLYNPLPLLSLIPRFKKICLQVVLAFGLLLLVGSVGNVAPDRYFLYSLVFCFDLLAYAKARKQFI